MPEQPQTTRNRVAFLVDGFNVYHSLCAAIKAGHGSSLKWLNLVSLSRSFLYTFGRDAVLQGVHYFTALAEWRKIRDPEVVDRHKAYIAVLEDAGVEVHLGKFKRKQVWCSNCKTYREAHEEKETDVAIGAKLLELLVTDACDTVVIVSGDTDLVAAIKTAKKLFPGKRVGVGFPYQKYNAELQQVADSSFKIRPHRYQSCQFPDPVILVDGRKIFKPTNW